MREFARLIARIEQTNSTNEKVDLMSVYFKDAEAEEGAWALYFLSGQRPRKFISSGKLRSWAEELAGLPAWLAEECYSAVGDTAEMIALIVSSVRPEGRSGVGPESEAQGLPELSIASWMHERLEPLRNADESHQKTMIQSWWRELAAPEIFVLNKLMTGALRIGVSETLVYRALSQAFGVPRPIVAARLLGKWAPSREFFRKVVQAVDADESGKGNTESAAEALPVPFCLAASLEGPAASLGEPAGWQVEWKWDGIRAQAVKNGGKIELWSRGEERVSEAFPDLVEVFSRIPGDFTLDGEILAGQVESPGSFSELQKRLNRKKPSAALTRDNPVCFVAYDLLREAEQLLNARPLRERRVLLERFVSLHGSSRLGVSPLIPVTDWAEAALAHAQAREHRAEGLMIKRRDAPYATGRKRGIWFKWKVDPLTLDAVLTAAQPGTGRRASLYTDYTFGVWSGAKLVPITKAYSGLSDEEIRELDQWIRRNTLERHGPVRILKPERVFEIGFEGIARSSRHKSGYAVRFPRILRERVDKPAVEADRVETVRALHDSLEVPMNPVSDASRPLELFSR